MPLTKRAMLTPADTATKIKPMNAKPKAEAVPAQIGQHRPELSEGDATPWGPVQTVEQKAPGVLVVTTAGHGGIWLSPDRVAALPALLRHAPTFKPSGLPGRWFEEDCDAVLPVLALPDLWTPQAVWNAVRAARTYSGSDSDPYPLTMACRAFLATAEATPTLKIAAAWEASYDPAHRWERLSMSGMPGVPGWEVGLKRNGEAKTVQFADYPGQQFYTDKELLTLTIPPLTEDQKERLRATAARLAAPQVKEQSPIDRALETLLATTGKLQAARPNVAVQKIAGNALDRAESVLADCLASIEIDRLRREQAQRQAEAAADQTGAFDGFQVTSDADPGL